MKIVMSASESMPLAKTGGLADVVHALSAELVKMNHEVFIIMPYYQSIRDKFDINTTPIAKYQVYLSWRIQECEVYKTVIDGITYYLLGNAHYFNRQNLYGYDDDNERFAFLTIATRKVIQELNIKPDIIHCHDWHVGMLPVIIKEQSIFDDNFKHTKFVLTIHNPAFKGLFDPYLLGDYYSLDQECYTSGRVRYNWVVSSLKAAIMYCDKITTVSPTHAEELLSENSGHELHSVLELRRFDFSGILNGIDYTEFDPETDTKIARNFKSSSMTTGKKANKEDLLKEFNLRPNNRPLFGMVSRLTWQKGSELVIAAAHKILAEGCSLVILGSGEYNFEQELEKLRAQYPDTMGIYIGYNDALAHRIYAATDIFLMPSLFEPCGIGQMIALRYGTLPLVRMTGGLNDTVVPYIIDNRDVATGFGFYAYEAQAIVNTVSWAISCYDDSDLFKKLRKNAISCNNDWAKSATEYLSVYAEAMRK